MVMQEVELHLSPSALLMRCAGQRGAFVLDGGGTCSWGSGDAVLGFRPRATLRVDHYGHAVLDDGAVHQWQGDPFELLDRFRIRCRAAVAAPGPDAAVIAALSYDLRYAVERLAPRPPEGTLPVLYAAFYDWLLWYSYHDGRYRLACSSPAQARDIAAEIQELAASTPRGAAPTSRLRHDCTKEQYFAAVAAALEYIAAGDIYQINLAQRFTVAAAPPPPVVFAGLQQHRVPFAAYVDAADFTLMSNSPECWLRLQDGRVATFPIKGTRPRGADGHADARLVYELQHSPKECAEHLMIVDLERNDLGRICHTGSVRVERFAQVESYPSLHHMVSTISGQLRPEVRFADVLRATFPGGSITGAPKVRAMEIIDALEPVGRGFYTGAIGRIGLDGSAAFNLAIRTAVATAGRATYHAGGGIVADSVAESEYEETLLKARPFFAAVSGA